MICVQYANIEVVELFIYYYYIRQNVYPELGKLFQILEVDFQPLKMSSNVAPSFQFLENNELLSVYLTTLQDVAITKILKQVCMLKVIPPPP